MTLTAILKMISMKLPVLGMIFLFFQTVNLATKGTSEPIPVHDPWFLIFVAWWVFSSVVAGMPEPTQQSSNSYLWAYRTGHIMSASGTSYFRNKTEFPRGPIPGE